MSLLCRRPWPGVAGTQPAPQRDSLYDPVGRVPDLAHALYGHRRCLCRHPIACRTKRETEDLIGFFANTLVLRTDLSQNPTFRQLLERVREVVLGGQEHQELPFEELVDALKPARALSHSPLFQVLFALQTTLAEAVRLPGLHVEITEVDAAAAKFDLSLDMAETEAGLEGAFEYNTDLFDAATVARMAGHFQTLLAGIVATPDCRLHELPLLSVEERQEALLVGPDDRVTDECFDFAAVFSAQVERSPGAVAVECRGQPGRMPS